MIPTDFLFAFVEDGKMLVLEISINQADDDFHTFCPLNATQACFCWR